MKLACDLDGVLASFTDAYTSLLISISGRDLFPKDFLLNPAFPPEWDYDRRFGYTEGEISETWQRIKESEDFWQELYPLPGAYAAVKQLDWLAASGHHVYFLTSRAGKTAKRQSEQWLSGLGMACPTVLVVEHGWEKIRLVQGLNVNTFIDDCGTTVRDVAICVENKAYAVCGHLYLYSQPYNDWLRRPDIKVVGSMREWLREEGVWP